MSLVPPVHARPGAVQMSGPVTGQQSSPAPPHVNAPLVQLPIEQVVNEPHIDPSATHVPETQQPSIAHALSAQQGPSAAPQATRVPSLQTMPLMPTSPPEATQEPALQHAPPLHMSPAQHG